MTDDPLLGRQLANFRLERILGRGGMGQVYYGWDVKLQRPVAVKVIDLRFRNNPAYARRFVHEAQAVATWRHENIAQVYYADEESDLYYFAMEYVDGLDLGQLLAQYAAMDKLMPPTDVLRIGRALASALDYAHARGVIHRDVKPSNVIVARDDRVVLTDFGLALDVQQGSMGEVFGTAHYIAPEQARRSSAAIPQSDLYSLGIILFQMLTGVVPFDDPSPTAVALQHLTQPPPAPRTLNPNLNTETESVLLKALSKSPHERYQSGDELIMALENAIQTSDVPSKLAPLPPPPAGMRLQPQPALHQVTKVDVKDPLNVPHTATAPLSQANPGSAAKHPVQRRSTLWLPLGGCTLILIAAIVVTSLLFANQLDNLFQVAAPTPDAQSTVSLLGPADSSLPSDVSITGESTLTLPLETPTLELLTTPPPSTVKYPNGKRFMLLYDDNSLYLLNLSDSNVPINWVAFERLSDTDMPLNRFNGSNWAKYYSTSKPGWCMALEILDSASHLDPPECGHGDLFLSLRTPVRNDPVVFWTAKEASSQFRVLWREGGQDEEVARCEIAAGTCEVFLP